MSDILRKPNVLFETSWEVCNKVGGIYTVLSTKAKVLHKQLGDNLIFVGPDVWTKSTPSPFFKESKTVLKEWVRTANLPEGISVRVGRWTVPGNPIAILVKFDGIYGIKNEIYKEMWEKYGVDSLHAYGDYDEGCAFGVAAAMVIDSCAASIARRGDHIVVHFDEWTTGMGLLYLNAHAPRIATVFTTHATSIGRSICGNNKPLYDYFEGYNGDQMAAELNMQSKHSLEKAAAHTADCFTTVSQTTARECAQLLERDAVVTPNGFERDFVPQASAYDDRRKAARTTLLNVAKRLTGKSYKSDTFLIATSGRNEFRNKGLDMFVDAVNKLRNTAPQRHAVAFVLVPAWVQGPRADLEAALRSTKRTTEPLEDPVITHTLYNYAQDNIYNRIQYLGMHNAVHESVDIIYVPCYLNGTDGIFNTSYYDLLIGMDACVFPSYYEPWGYTPHESLSFGIPTITTNLAGFGQWILSTFGDDMAESGCRVITRTDSNYHAAVDTIASTLSELLAMRPAKIKQLRATAMAASRRAEWTQFIEYYDEAYSHAIDSRLTKLNKK